MGEIIDLAAYRTRPPVYADLKEQFRVEVDRALIGVGLDPADWQQEQLVVVAVAFLHSAHALAKCLSDDNSIYATEDC